MMLLGVMLAAALQTAAPQAQPAAARESARPSTSAKAVARPAKKAAPRVVIDAGHGGRDPGGPMASGYMREKDIALQIALKVGDVLRAKGVIVIFTRTKDTLIALDDRGRLANQARGDLFISIHVNAANPHWRNPEAARGVETYFLAEAKTEDARRVEEMENEAVRFESDTKVDASDPLSFILSDMMQNEHLRESADLADIVQRHLSGAYPGPSRGVKQAGFRVLVSAFMPAVLVEIGFGTNAEDASYISNAAKQRAMAKAIADAIGEYLERHQRRVGGGAAGGVGSSGTHD
jgi:N-acetylmuramoyl-L-alanine amidase